MNCINLRHLNCFCEVFRRRSINAASHYVYLSQSAITQALSKLEMNLGAQLFLRSSSGMYPTEAGEIYYGRVQHALDLIEKGAKEAQSHTNIECSEGTKGFYRMVTAHQLRALIAIFETGDFNLAARFSGISKSSIHRHTKALERLAGIPIFEKSRIGVTFTSASQILIRYAKLAFTEIENAQAEINALVGNDTGRIVIGGMPLARTYILPKAVTVFLSEYPDHNVKILDGPYEYLMNGLRSGDIDLLLGALRDPLLVGGVEQEFLLDDPLAIVARTDHPIFKTKKLTINTLAAYSWITPSEGRPLRARFEDLFEDLGQKSPKRIVECSSFIAMRGLLLESDSLALMSTHQLQYGMGEKLISILPFPVKDIFRKIAITTREEWNPTRPQERFVEILHQVSACK
ncbi:MAG: LysR family transcriptional regulator [Emcibacter sp.]|nr:LysR family transcriptional regulator [Emcibacter sp.]